MATVAEQVQQIYIGLLGRAADQNGATYWENQINSGAITLDQMRANFVQEQPEYASGLGSLSRADAVTELYSRMFERTPETEGAAYWITGEGSGIPIDQLSITFMDAALGNDITTLANKTEAAIAYTAAAGNEYTSASALTAIDSVDHTQASLDASLAATLEAFGTPGGQTIALTNGRDIVTGTDNNDDFIGLVSQNQNGALSNAFSTGDRLDGGAGVDTVTATVIDDVTTDDGAQEAINARTVNVENAVFEVLGQNVKVDAGRMDSVREFWSDNSASDLEISDVRLGSKLAVTKDITFGLRSVDTGAGLVAAFDTQSLTNEGATKADSQLLIRIADVSTETPEAPLTNVNMQLSFELGGQSYNITDLQSADGTYAGLVTALESALLSLGLSSLEVKLGEAYNQVTFADNTVTLPFTANQILLNDPNGEEFGAVTFEQSAIDPVTGGFLVAGNAEPFDPTTSTALIETNLILDDAGRGSTAGDVVIGGMSNSEQAIEKLNLMVDRDSKISQLVSGTDLVDGFDLVAFEQIEVTSLENNGNLSIDSIGNTQLFNASEFKGEELTVTGFAGSNDTEGNAYSYTTADSKDSVTISIDLDDAALHTFSLDTNTQGGNDTVTYLFDEGTDSNLLNSAQLSNVNVNTGAGDDTVRLDVVDDSGNEEHIVGDVELGSGKDAVFVANDNTQKEEWVFNADQSGGSFVGRGNDEYKAFGIKLKVEFQGIESQIIEVAYDTAGFTTSAQAINDAIKEAIASDDNLKHLLATEDLRDNGLQISSLVDRDLDASALNVEFIAPKYTGDDQDDDTGRYQNDTITTFDARTVVSESDMEAAWAAWYPDSDGIGAGASAAGTVYDVANASDLFDAMFEEVDSNDINSNGIADTAEVDANPNADANLNNQIGSYNKLNTAQGADASEKAIVELNGGSGNDLFVLNSNKTANAGYATVELSEGFGHDTILNFNTGTVSGTADVIDYTAFLDEVAHNRGASASTVTANDLRIEQDVKYAFQNEAGPAAGITNVVIDHNKVISVNLSELFPELTATAGALPTDFDSVTAAMIERAINETLDDSNYLATGGDISAEDKLVGSKVVFNIVQDKHFESDGTNTVMGDVTDFNTLAVFTATVAHDGATASTGNLSLTGVTKQGSIEFGDMYSDLSNLTDESVFETPAQTTAAQEIADELADANNNDVQVNTNITLSPSGNTSYFIHTGVELSTTMSNLVAALNNGATFEGPGTLVITDTTQTTTDLGDVYGRPAVDVSIQSNATTIVGLLSNIEGMYASGDISGLDGTEAFTVLDTTLAATAATTFAGTTTGIVTFAGNTLTVNGNTTTVTALTALTNVAGLGDANITVDDATLAATVATTFAGTTTGTVTFDGTVITGDAADIQALYALTNDAGLEDSSVTIEDTTSLAAAVVTTMNGLTTGIITVDATAITGSYSDLNVLYTTPLTEIVGLGDEAITIEDATLAATNAATIDAFTSGTVTVDATAINGTVSELQAISAIDTSGAAATIDDASGADVAAATINTLNSEFASLTATNAIDLTGTHTVIGTAAGNITGTVNAVIDGTALTVAQLTTLDAAVNGTITTNGGTLDITGVAGGANFSATNATDTIDLSSLTDTQTVSILGLDNGDTLSLGVTGINASALAVDTVLDYTVSGATITWEISDNGIVNETTSVILLGLSEGNGPGQFTINDTSGIITIS